MPAFRMPFKPQTGAGAADPGQFGTCSAVFKHRHTPLAPKPLEGAHTATAVNICDAVRARHRVTQAARCCWSGGAQHLLGRQLGTPPPTYTHTVPNLHTATAMTQL